MTTLAVSLDAAQDALVAAIVTRAANVASPMHVSSYSAGQVPVDLGDPGQSLQPEHVWVGEDAEVVATPLTSGSVGATFTGEYTLAVVVWVERSGDDFKANRDRATSLTSDIESVIGGPSMTVAGALLDSWIESVNRQSGVGTASTGIMTTVRLKCTDMIP